MLANRFFIFHFLISDLKLRFSIQALYLFFLFQSNSFPRLHNFQFLFDKLFFLLLHLFLLEKLIFLLTNKHLHQKLEIFPKLFLIQILL